MVVNLNLNLILKVFLYIRDFIFIQYKIIYYYTLYLLLYMYHRSQVTKVHFIIICVN